MDRSFLSRAEVIAASRRFVCVRLMTYENKEEADFLKTLFVGRSGEVENTTFALLSPDGKRPLVRPGREPRGFEDAAKLAETMNRIAGDYEVKQEAGRAVPPLPAVANVRLALNVAACDDRPLLVVCAPESERKALEAKVAALAWSEEFVGRFVSVTAAAKDLGSIDGVEVKEGVLVVAPDAYGRKGKVLKQVEAGATSAQVAEALRAALARHQARPTTALEHIRAGRSEGVFWDTVIPVTDPLEKRAREPGRKRE